MSGDVCTGCIGHRKQEQPRPKDQKAHAGTTYQPFRLRDILLRREASPIASLASYALGAFMSLCSSKTFHFNFINSRLPTCSSCRGSKPIQSRPA
eukprot:scaffold320181_cov32-Tisochrysis_lutea.AAC.4